jgi:hypothetical protein
LNEIDENVVIRQRYFSREFVVRFRHGLVFLPLAIIGLTRGGDHALIGLLVTIGVVVVIAYPLTAWIIGSSSLAIVDGSVRYTRWLRHEKSIRLGAIAEVVEIPVTLYRPDLGFHERWLFFVAHGNDVALHAYAGFYSPEQLERFREALGVPWERVDRTMTPAQVRRALPHSFSWPAAHWVLTLLALLVAAYLATVLVLTGVYALPD